MLTYRDVVFDEESTWEWNMQQSTQALYDCDTEEKHLTQPSTHEELSNSAHTYAETSPTRTTASVEIPEIEAVEETELDGETQSLRQIRKRPAWMQDYEETGTNQSKDVAHFALFADCDPKTFEGAIKEEKWRRAMDEEIDAIERDTWELSDLLKGQKTIGVKWVYKTKLKENDEVDKYKA